MAPGSKRDALKKALGWGDEKGKKPDKGGSSNPLPSQQASQSLPVTKRTHDQSTQTAPTGVEASTQSGTTPKAMPKGRLPQSVTTLQAGPSAPRLQEPQDRIQTKLAEQNLKLHTMDLLGDEIMHSKLAQVIQKVLAGDQHPVHTIGKPESDVWKEYRKPESPKPGERDMQVIAVNNLRQVLHFKDEHWASAFNDRKGPRLVDRFAEEEEDHQDGPGGRARDLWMQKAFLLWKYSSHSKGLTVSGMDYSSAQSGQEPFTSSSGIVHRFYLEERMTDKYIVIYVVGAHLEGNDIMRGPKGIIRSICTQLLSMFRNQLDLRFATEKRMREIYRNDFKVILKFFNDLMFCIARYGVVTRRRLPVWILLDGLHWCEDKSHRMNPEVMQILNSIAALSHMSEHFGMYGIRLKYMLIHPQEAFAVRRPGERFYDVQMESRVKLRRRTAAHRGAAMLQGYGGTELEITEDERDKEEARRIDKKARETEDKRKKVRVHALEQIKEQQDAQPGRRRESL